jgi:hypothetical protein
MFPAALLTVALTALPPVEAPRPLVVITCDLTAYRRTPYGYRRCSVIDAVGRYWHLRPDGWYETSSLRP